MKTVLSVLTLAAVMTACNNRPETGNENLASTGNVVVLKDTSGLAEFQAWKAYQADKAISEYKSQTTAAYVPARKKASSAKTVSKRPTPVASKTETLSTEAAYPAKAPEKKGWSKAAKGAAIGGASGAVLGAVVHKKNRVLGGVVGGVVGAGAGYGIGRTMDKKDGRYLVGQ